ncbi:MAG: iron-sulfur cluster assembly scaffold protein, partial [bacterium]|nr:iron-sulfur cluster assembly scaffold protein [bacterium]
CGDVVEFSLEVRNGMILSVSLEISGCINTHACAKTVAFMAEGRKVSQAWSITPEKVKDYLETLPSHEFHCAELAVRALRKALVKFTEIKRSPWKKMYS